jgi:hypothetical protein
VNIWHLMKHETDVADEMPSVACEMKKKGVKMPEI